MHEDGFDGEWRTDLLGGRFPAAIFHPRDAAIQPARLVHRLAERAAAAGVAFVERSRVESLDELGAERVLVATDGYPSGLLGALEGLIIPTRGQMIATEPVEERLFDCPHYGRHGFDYWQQTPDGRILAGGFRDFSLDSEFTADEETTPTIQGALESFVTELVGRPVEVTHRWAGIFGLVLDFLPVVGRVPDDERAWVAGGYSGHGNVLGFMCGDLVARAMLGDPHAAARSSSIPCACSRPDQPRSRADGKRGSGGEEAGGADRAAEVTELGQAHLGGSVGKKQVWLHCTADPPACVFTEPRAEAAADHDRLEVGQVYGRGRAGAEGANRTLDQTFGELVVLFQRSLPRQSSSGESARASPSA